MNEDKIHPQEICTASQHVDIPMRRKLKVFYSYAHKESAWYQRVRVHLKPLVQDGLIEEWSDEDLRAGEWSPEIMNQLDSADIILLLVTADYIASDNCETEYIRAMERHEAAKRGENDGGIVIPIWLTPADYKHAIFGKLQPFPAGNRAVSQRPDPEAALQEVNQQIREVVDRYSQDRACGEVEAQPLAVMRAVEVADDDPAGLLPHLCDRTDQEISVRQLFADQNSTTQELAEGPPEITDPARRPYVFLVHGRDIDCPEGFKSRLESVLLPEVLREASALIPIPLADWPTEYESESSAKRAFQWRLASCLGCELSAIPRALRPNSPTFITVHLPDTVWKKNGEELLNAFLHFWEEFPDLPSGQRLIVGIFVEYRGGELSKSRPVGKIFERLLGLKPDDKLHDRASGLHPAITAAIARLAGLRSYQRIHGRVLKRLNNIELDHALNWADHLRIRAYCAPTLRVNMIAEVRAQFAHANEKPMKELVSPLTSILVKYRKGGASHGF